MHCLVGRPKNFMIITSISPICVSLKDLSNRHANGAHGEQATVAAAPWKLNYSPPSCLTMLGGWQHCCPKTHSTSSAKLWFLAELPTLSQFLRNSKGAGCEHIDLVGTSFPKVLLAWVAIQRFMDEGVLRFLDKGLVAHVAAG